MTSEKQCRKEKNQNIQVFVRLRPLNQREKDIKSLGVVEVVHNREVVVRHSQQIYTKKFTFDRAFGPNAKQLEVYQEVVSPLIEEVLAGYNCTVFAYGQTGTGKTHTMIGENTGTETNWQKDPLAGIVPRALGQLFDELRLTNTEYTIRVSYLELYNEELFDLLSTSEDNSKLRIYEDVTRKGTNIVNGLEEVTVYSKQQVYEIMNKGQERKRVASTLMNSQSSRSHTVFTIVVHMKENSPDGEELMKIGKLNLVDLAGSENISKAGSDNPARRERARECVNINQSLLTLGRVITALVERHPHVPYRESKLTRILQESLGGRTKTSIIATISPGHKDLEETLSTLEYANRAKNIQNKPEINQKLTKKAILKDFVEEIDKLKRDLQAARDKNGVYLANETFAEITLKQEEQRKEIQELLLRKKVLEEEKDKMDMIFQELNQKLDIRDSELNKTKNKLNLTKEKLFETHYVLKSTQQQYEEQCHLVSRQRQTEAALGNQAKELLATADLAVDHVARLHDNVTRHKKVESTNLEVTKAFCSESSEQRERILDRAKCFAHRITDTVDNMHSGIETCTTSNIQTLNNGKQTMESLAQRIYEQINELKTMLITSHDQMANSVACRDNSMNKAMNERQEAIKRTLEGMLSDMEKSTEHAQQLRNSSNVAGFVQQWLSGAIARVDSLRRCADGEATRSRQARTNRANANARQRDGRRARLQRRAININACVQEIEAEKAAIEKRLIKKLEDIDTERRETEETLNAYIEEERRSLEERLKKHAATVNEALNKRLDNKMVEIQEEKSALQEKMDKLIEWQKMQLTVNEEETEIAESDFMEFEKDREECESCSTKYEKQFDESTSAISVDMEVFSRNVLEVFGHSYDQLMAVLGQSKKHVENDTNTIMATEKESREQLARYADVTLANVLEDNKKAIENVYQVIEANSTSTIQELSQLSATASVVISSTEDCSKSHDVKTKSVKEMITSYEQDLKEAVTRQANAENLYLSNEYKVYSPTGKTPTRVEYRYPRMLAATSPHESILAKFRAMRRQNDEECILIESDTETHSTSESELSTSGDSTMSTVPSTPSSNGYCDNTEQQMRPLEEDQGKENNMNGSALLKKRSKLPGPMMISHKKPLMERNEIVQ